MVERQGHRWVFRVHSDQSEQMYVAGDFNHWSPTQCPMRRGVGGMWECELRLPPGKYRFRYYCTKRGWLTDWAAFGVERNHTGGWDSILLVPARVAWPVRRRPTRMKASPVPRLKLAV